MGHSAQFGRRLADEHLVKLFGREDAAPGGPTADPTSTAPRPKSRLNEQCAKLREVHVELDDIEGRLTALRARQAASRLRASAPRPPAPTVPTLDLRTPDAVELRDDTLDHVAEPQRAEAVRATEVDEPTDDDFEKRFAAFAAGESDDSSRRWLDFG